MLCGVGNISGEKYYCRKKLIDYYCRTKLTVLYVSCLIRLSCLRSICVIFWTTFKPTKGIRCGRQGNGIGYFTPIGGDWHYRISELGSWEKSYQGTLSHKITPPLGEIINCAFFYPPWYCRPRDYPWGWKPMTCALCTQRLVWQKFLWLAKIWNLLLTFVYIDRTIIRNPNWSLGPRLLPVLRNNRVVQEHKPTQLIITRLSSDGLLLLGPGIT